MEGQGLGVGVGVRVQGRERGQDPPGPVQCPLTCPSRSGRKQAEEDSDLRVSTAHPWGRPRVQEAHREEEPITMST